MIHEAFGLHFAGISLILPISKCYHNYSTPERGLELSLLIASYCHFVFCNVSVLVSWKTKRLTLGRGTVHANKQDLKGGHARGVFVTRLLVGFVAALFPSQQPFSYFWVCSLIQRFEMTINLTS